MEREGRLTRGGRRTWGRRGAAGLEEPHVEGFGCAGQCGRQRWSLAKGGGPGGLPEGPQVD